MPTPQPSSTLFPYTTLFRSGLARPAAASMHDSAVSFAFIGVSFALMSWVFVTGPWQECSRRAPGAGHDGYPGQDRKSTRLNSSHLGISYAVFCLKKKNKHK